MFLPRNLIEKSLIKHGIHNWDALFLSNEIGLRKDNGSLYKHVLAQYEIEPAEMLVVHDELDLSPGVARLKMGGGHGGHNGLKDIIAHLGSKDFWRLRFGIGHPGERAEVSDYVLNNPRPEERELINDAMQQAQNIAHLVIEGKTEAAMLKLHSA